MNDEIRVGVFLCQCGGQISNILSTSRIERSIKKHPNVSFIATSDFPCSKGGLQLIQAAIQEKNLNRIVIAGCSARLMEQVFSKAIAQAGLQPGMVAIVNIRDHCARVHQKEKSLATTKAISMISAAIDNLIQQQHHEKLRQKVNPVVGVIGGGIAGISAALSLANRGARVKLIEKENQLGGLLNSINLLYPRDISAQAFLEDKLQQLKNNSNIEVLAGAAVKHIAGGAGNFKITYSHNANEFAIDAGAIIFAAGGQYLYPDGLYDYGSNGKIITQLEFERMVNRNEVTAKNIVFVQCVGSRNEERPYCARFCCPTTFKNVIWLKKKDPELKITVIFRGLTEYIREYDEAMDLGVLFIRYDPKRLPEVTHDCIAVKDDKTEKEFEIPFDLLVLATPIIPKDEAKSWSNMLHLPIDEYGFILEPHIKLRPGRFAPNGIFVAGSVHWPGMIGDCISQGYSAAARAHSLLEQKTIEREPVVAEIDPATCRGCGRCVEECPFQAISLIDDEGNFKHATINDFICKGCGMCSVVCICGAVSVKHLSDMQLDVMVGGMSGK